MRAYSALQPTHEVPRPADVTQTLLLAGGAAQSLDWSSTLAQLVRFTGWSTAGVTLNFRVNLESAGANLPSSGTTASTATSSGVSAPVLGTRTFQIPAGSTGWSAIAHSSGYITAESWRI